MDEKKLSRYIEKHSRQEAAVFFKISLSTLDRKLRKWNLTQEGWGSRKLNHDKANQIRDLYFTDKYTQKQLSEMFGVSRETINKVINGKVYPPPPNIGFGGTADVKVTYFYVANQ